VRLLLALAMLVFLPGVARAAWERVVLLSGSALALPLAGGVAVGVLAEQFVLRRWRRLEIFEHELTHALTALLFLRRIERIEVRRDSGAMHSSGGFGGALADDVVGLAPYLLPTFTLILVLARRWVPGSWFPWYDAWVGFTLGFHLWTALREYRDNGPDRALRGLFPDRGSRSDIGRRGTLYSLIFIATLTLAVHALVFTLLLGGFRAVPALGHQVWAGAAGVATWLWHAAAALFRRLWAMHLR
jgi:hypothetical protein